MELAGKRRVVPIYHLLKDARVLACRCEAVKNKDRAIREKQEAKLIFDLTKLQRRVLKSRLKEKKKIQRSIGRLLTRLSAGSTFLRDLLRCTQKSLSWNELTEKKAKAQKLDGSYVLKTDRQGLTAEEIWRTYILLTRVEDASRDIKSPLMERPIFHHLQDRTQTYFSLCPGLPRVGSHRAPGCRRARTPPGEPFAISSARIKSSRSFCRKTDSAGYGKSARLPFLSQSIARSSHEAYQDLARKKAGSDKKILS
jgi:hypothetical protein